MLESLALIALICNIVAYRQQAIQRYRLYSGLAMLLLSLHFFGLSAHAAGIACALAVIRNAVSMHFNGWRTTSLFVMLNLIALAYEWLVLKHGPEIFLVYSVSIIFTVGTLRLQDTTKLKKIFFGAELLSIVYCFFVSSIFGAIYGLFNAAVILHWWIQHRKQPLK